MSRQSFTFQGFEQSNTTPVPDVLFDELLSKLSGAELKVLLYIIRRTRGFKKDTDAISLSQFEKGIVTNDGRILDRGCGLNRETICKALKSLEERGCIKSEKRKDRHGDNDITLYSIHFRGEVVGKSAYGSRKSEPPEVVGKSAQGGRKKSTRVVGKSDPQETVKQETVKQETERKNGDVSAKQESLHSSIHPSSSFQNSSLQEKQEEVTLTEEEQAIYDFGCQTIFKAKPPKKTAKLQGECAEIAKHVKKAEQFQSLLQFVRALPYLKGQIHLKNLVNELNGWLQSLEARPSGSSRRKVSPTATPRMSEEEKAAVEARTERNLAKLRAAAAAKGVF